MSNTKESKVLSYKDFQGTVEVSLEDNCVFGRVLHIDDVITYEADFPLQLQKSFEEAIDDYLEFCKTQGSNPNKPYKGVFNVRVGSDIHKQVALFARKRGSTLNEVVKEAIAEKVNRASSFSTVVHKYEYHLHGGESQ
ncbi:MAG: type II toxin-antitoxin system HicB family antitoxin, partial [Nitrosospira sp.]